MRNNEVMQSSYVGPVNGWKMLGVGIVKQAILDWKEADRKLRHPLTATHEMSEQKNSAQKFLVSPLCEFYSGCDGRTLLRKLKAGEC